MDIIIFAALAFYLLYKLYSILGQEGSQESFLNKFNNSQNVTNTAIKTPAVAIELFKDHKFASTLKLIHDYDHNFSEENFLGGAKKFFEILIKAFCAKDKSYLKTLMSANVYEKFLQQLTTADDKKQTIEKILVAIKEIEIVEANVKEKQATIAVKFISEQINLIRDAEGVIIHGDPTEVELLEDVWQLSRNLEQNNPNWLLVGINI
jgi:predicted lipid-binding transport protein (Tim44 family)